MKHVRNGFHSTLIVLGALLIAGVSAPVAAAAGSAGWQVSANNDWPTLANNDWPTSPNNDWPTH